MCWWVWLNVFVVFVNLLSEANKNNSPIGKVVNITDIGSCKVLSKEDIIMWIM